MKQPKKIAILGVGFMGGSLALALKKKFPKISLWGYARNNKSYQKLKKLKILDRVERNMEKLVKDADFVALATPAYVIVDHLKKIAQYIRPKTVVFDLGSTKALIEERAQKVLPQGISFVGCHPLCGSEKSGASFSQKNLYQDSICIITSSPWRKSTKEVKKIWEKLGAKVIYLSSHLHDKVLSCTSHLPHLISFSLIQTVPPNYLKISSASLKDLTRISNSPALVWTDLFLSNAKNVSYDLDEFIKILKKFKILIKNKDRSGILKLIKKANRRQKILSGCK